MKKIPIDIVEFKELIERDFYYVDKTKVIEELISTGAKTILYTRPRRFGKSLLLSTLYYFFNIEDKEENKKLFCNTYIGKTKYMEYFGKYPVIRLDFKTLMGNSYEEILESYKSMISKVYSKLDYVYDNLKEEDKVVYDNIKFRRASLDDYKKSLVNLTEYLHDYYNENVVVLIDEYDTAINDGYINGFYDEIINLIQPILYNALKGNIYIQMSILTGVLRVGSASLFSKFNNVDVYDVMSEHYDEYFGFTKEETKELLEYYGLELTKEVSNYYDGYVFGSTNVYNPWSILNYANRKNLSPYWLSTGSNKLIKKLLKELIDENIINELIQGNVVSFNYDKSITYENFTEPKNLTNLLNLLLVTGYLTYSHSETNQITKMERKYFKIPNFEVLNDFKNIISSVTFNKTIIDMDGYDNFIDALISGNKEGVEKFINSILPSASYHDFTGEQPYHLYMLILLSAFINKNVFEIKSNRESGNGRPDIIIQSLDKSFGLIIEIKETKEIDKMESKASVGIKQTETKSYIMELKNEGFTNVQSYVIVFCGKTAIVR